MEFAKIETDVWSDPDFESLSRDGKLLWIFLLSNDRNNFAGIYEISKHRMAIETGIDNIEEVLSEVTDTLSIVYDHPTNTVWIKNFLSKYNPNAKQLKGVGKFLDKVNSSSLVRDFLDYNDTLDIPYTYPMDTPGVDKDKDKDKDKDNNVEIQNPNEPTDTKDGSSSEPSFTEGDIEYELALKLRERIADWHDPVPGQVPDPDPQDMSKWAYDMDKLLRLGPLGGNEGDGPTPEQVEYILKWIYEIDDFWRDTIQSPHGLRKNISTITAQIRRYKNNGGNGRKFDGQSEEEYLKDIAGSNDRGPPEAKESGERPMIEHGGDVEKTERGDQS